MNIVGMMGRVVRDPVVRATTKSKVANLTIVVDQAGDFDPETGKNKDGFFEVEAWGAVAEIAEKYVTKGKIITVQGQLKQHKWQDADGKNREQNKILCNKIGFVPGSRNTEEAYETSTPTTADEYDPFS